MPDPHWQHGKDSHKSLFAAAAASKAKEQQAWNIDAGARTLVALIYLALSYRYSSLCLLNLKLPSLCQHASQFIYSRSRISGLQLPKNMASNQSISGKDWNSNPSAKAKKKKKEGKGKAAEVPLLPSLTESFHPLHR